MGVAKTRTPCAIVWGLRTRPKSWPTRSKWSVDLLGQPLYRNHVFEIFSSEPPKRNELSLDFIFMYNVGLVKIRVPKPA